jgi:peptidoglycan/LPS O-acetylase OafA/YrhL
MRRIFENLARGTKWTHALFVQEWDRLNRAIFPRITFQSTLARSAQYRPEIDGLRALAVLSVLFFHTEIPGFSGGFVGVDIFYVISGYLITSVIARDVVVRRFSFVSFYDRRIRRIFPALFTVVFFSILAGSVLLIPKDFAVFGKSLIAMTFFVSNIFFKKIGGAQGYFGDDSHSQVLLHTWSLSVEEQFYLFFPTTLILLARFAKRRSNECIWLGAIVSFAINIWATYHRPHGAFYFLIPRTWELLLGALLAMNAVPPLKRRVSREIAGLTGLALIAWAVSVFTTDTTFPGFAVLFPCLGAGLIMYAGGNGPSFVRTILSLRPLVFIGVISYSLYLWHWPIIVFGKYLAAGDLTSGDTTLIILLSLLMAFISFEFIESPFRGKDSPITRRQIFSFGLAASALSAALGFTIYSSQGFPGRFDVSTRELISKNVQRKSDFEFVCSNWKTEIKSVADLTLCNIGEGSSKKIMFWGDSHVQQLYPLIREIYDSGGLREHGVVFTVAPGCPPTENMNRPEPGFHCDSFGHFAMMRSEEEDVDTVFIGFSPPDTLCPSVDGRCVGKISDEESRQRFVQQLSDYIRSLKMRGKGVILSLPFPCFDKSPPDLQIRNAVLQRFKIVGAARPIDPLNVRNQLESLAEHAGAEIFDPRMSLCRERGCITETDGVSIYKDDNHLAASRIGILEENMKSTLQRMMPTE